MQGEIKVRNIMADGTICEDLSTYLDTHELPDLAKRLAYEFILDGIKIMDRKNQEKTLESESVLGDAEI